MAGVAHQEPEIDQMGKTGPKGCPPSPNGRKQGRLPPRNTVMHRRQNVERPSSRRQLDKIINVHKV